MRNRNLILISIFLLIVSSISGYASLVANYTFDSPSANSSIVNDTSGFNHHTSIFNATYSSTGGFSNGWVNFSNSNTRIMNVPYFKTLSNDNTSTSVFTWIKPYSPDGSTRVLVAHYSTHTVSNVGNRSWALIANFTNNSIGVFIGNSTGSGAAKELYGNTSANLSDGNWHHVGFTINANNVQFYIDGVQASQRVGGVGNASISVLKDSPFNITMGIYGNGSGILVTNQGKQAQDEILIYNESLSGVQVTDLYNSYFPSSPVTYYVSNTGDDSNDGLSDSTPIKTINKLNTIALNSGDTVRFKRGDVWWVYNDEILNFKNGTTYADYGTGAYPIFYGAFNVSNTGNWTDETGGIWSLPLATYNGGAISSMTLYKDDNASVFRSYYNLSDFNSNTTQGTYYYNSSSDKLFIHSSSNPVTYYGNLYAGFRNNNGNQTGIFKLSNISNVKLQNLTLKFHAINGIDTNSVENLSISNINMSMIGGAWLDSTTKYGNGIQLWCTAKNVNITNNTLDYIIDAAITPQCSVGYNGNASNILINNNIITRTYYPIEMFSNGANRIDNVSIDHNTMVQIMDNHFGHSRQYDMLRISTANSSNITMTNNIIGNNSVYRLIEKATAINFTSNYNLYYGSKGSNMFTWNGSNRATVAALNTATGQEANGIEANPYFIPGTYQPAANSFACDVGSSGSDIGALPCSATSTMIYLYVNISSGSCSDAYTRLQASNPATPWCNITTAFSNIQSNDILKICGGTYRSTTNAYTIANLTNITLTTCSGAIPTITSYVIDANQSCVNQSNATHNLWNCSYTSGVTSIYTYYNDTGELLFQFSSLANLLNNTRTYKEGTYFGSNRMYFRFHNMSQTMTTRPMVFSRQYVLNVQNMSNMTIENLNFRYGTRGIHLTNSSNIILRNNTIWGGPRGGIDLSDSPASTNVIIINNNITMPNHVNWTWQQYKQSTSTMEGTGIIAEAGLGVWNISNNILNGHFNGIGTTGTAFTNFPNIEIAYNNMSNHFDDGIEIEYKQNGTQVHHNRISDTFTAISTIPVNSSASRTNISFNLITSGKMILADDDPTYWEGECYKLSRVNSTAPADYSEYGTEGILFDHNTCIGYNGVYSSSSDPPNDMININFTNNIFYTNISSLYRSGRSANRVFYDYNLYYPVAGYFAKYWNNDTSSTQYNTLSLARASTQWDGTWDNESINSDPLLIAGTYQPASNSPACTNASDGTTIGALPCSGAGYHEISACGNIIESGSYTVTTNITSTATCINVSVDNVIIDMMGKNISGTGSETGIYVKDRTNVTIKNGTFTNLNYAIDLYNTSNSIVNNINFYTKGRVEVRTYFSPQAINNLNINITNIIGNGAYSGGYMIDVEDVNNSFIENITCPRSVGYCVYLYDNGLDRSTNSVINRVTGVGEQSTVQATYVDNINVTNLNSINASGDASIYLSTLNNARIINASIYNNTYVGIYLDETNNTYIDNSSLLLIAGEGILIYNGLNITANNTNVSNASNNGFVVTHTGIKTNTNFILDNVILENNTPNNIYTSSNFTNLTIINQTAGKLVYKNASSISMGTQKLRDAIKISNNFVYVNSSIASLNRSAELTLYNIPTSYQNYKILKDGVICNAPACNNLTALNAGTVVFNVSSFSNYTIYYYNSTILDWGPTTTNTSNLSQNWIYANLTINTTNYKNTSIYLYNTTGIVQTYTSGNFTNFTTLPDSTYYINATVYDTTDTAFSTTTRTILLDTTNPSANITGPATNATKFNYTVNIQLNWTGSDSNLLSCEYQDDFSTGGTYVTTSCPGWVQHASIADGDHWIALKVTDLAGNINISNRTYSVDQTNPSILFSTGTTNTSNRNLNWIYANVSANDTNLQNISIKLYNQTQLVSQYNSTNYENITYDLSATDTGNWIGTTEIYSSMPYNDSIFIGSGSGKYGYYNSTTNTSYNLNNTGWTTTTVYAMYAVGDIIYLAGATNKFGYYNRSSNVTTNIAIGINPKAITKLNDGLYVAGSVGSIILRNLTSTVTTDLSTTDPGDWLTTSTIYTLTSYNNNVYIGGGLPSRFGFYNRTTNTSYDLSATDTGDWISTNPIKSLVEYNGKIYIGASGGKFGYYDPITNTSYDLGATGAWLNDGASDITSLVNLDGRIYIGASNGNLAVYDSVYNTTISLNGTTSIDSLSTINNNIYMTGTSGTFKYTKAYTSVNNSYYNFTSLSDGTYYLNATAYDTYGNINSTGTRTILLDATIPTINITLPYPNGSVYNNNLYTASGGVIWVNITSYDVSPTTCTIYTSSQPPYTLHWDNIGCNEFGGTTGYLEGDNFIAVNITDITGNSVIINRTFFIDSLNPNISFTTGTTNTSNRSVNWIYANVSITEPHYNRTNITLYNTSGLYASNSTSNSTNFTSLPDGTYYLSASTYDNYNNTNQTETRTILIDTISPVVSFNANTSSNTSNNWIYVSTNITEINWVSTNITLFNNGIYNTSVLANQTNFTGLADSNSYSFNATVCDIVNHCTTINQTSTTKIDTILPTISVGGNSPNTTNNSVYYNATLVRFNYTLNDTNLWGYNITCKNRSNGYQEYSIETTGLTSTYNVNQVKLFSSPGIKDCNLTVADSHTSNKFKPDVRVSKNLLLQDELKINDDITVIYDSGKSTVDLQDLGYEVGEDRISPKFTLKKDKKIETDVDLYWNVKFKGKVYSVDNSIFKGHIVIIPETGIQDGYWVDAEDGLDSQVTYEVDDDVVKYHTKIKNSDYQKNNIYQTKSIGGLNIITLPFSFQINQGRNLTITGSDQTTPQNVNVTVNITGVTDNIVYNFINTSTMAIGCGPSNIDISALGYINTYNLFSVNCTDLNLSYNYSFFDALLTVNVYSIQDGTLMSGVNVSITNTSIASTDVNPAVFNVTKNTKYLVNVSSTTSGMELDLSNYTINDSGSYVYDIYISRDMSVNIFDEFDNAPFNMTSPDSVYQYTYCLDGNTYTYLITSNNYSYVFPCQVEKVRYVITYPTDSYYRTFLPSSFNFSNSSTNIYLVDLDKSSVVFNTFQLYTLLNQYSNVRLYFTKNINGTDYQITSDYFNVETKVGTYLMYGQQYTVMLEADNYPTTILGYYTADSAGDKIIRLFNIGLGSTPTDIYSDSSWYLTNNNETGTQTIKVGYNSTNVKVATLSIYNETDNGTLLYVTGVASDQGLILYNVPAEFTNYTFFVKMNITKNTNEDVVFTSTSSLSGSTILDIVIQGFVSSTFVAWFLIILLSAIALLFSFSTAHIGGIVFIALGGLLIWLGWIWVAPAAFTLAIIVSIGSFLKRKYKMRG